MRRLCGRCPAVVPLVGLPGARLTGTRISDNFENAEVQSRSLEALYDRFRPDALLTMMDLTVEAEAIGMQVAKPDNGVYTVVQHTVTGPQELARLSVPDPARDGRMPVWLQVVKLLKSRVSCPVIAYVTGPFTLAGLLNGGTRAAMNVLRNPSFLKDLLEYCLNVVQRYCQELIGVGADAICICEPAASYLSPEHFYEFSGQYIARLVKDWPVPSILHICGDTTALLPKMIQTQVSCLSLDHQVDFGVADRVVPRDMMLMGNVDPVGVVGDGTREEVVRSVGELLESMQSWERLIISTGCDIPYEANLDNIAVFVDAARALSRESSET